MGKISEIIVESTLINLTVFSVGILLIGIGVGMMFGRYYYG